MLAYKTGVFCQSSLQRRHFRPCLPCQRNENLSVYEVSAPASPFGGTRPTIAKSSTPYELSTPMPNSARSKLLVPKTAFALVPIAMLLSACGGGGSSDISTANASPPLLRVGMQRQYTGTSTRSTIYVNPTSTFPNNTLSYSFTQSQSVLQAPANAVGKFDIRSVINYTITQDPGTGVVPISQTIDDFRDLITTGSTQATLALGQTSTLLNNDESSNAFGNGPFTQTITTTSTYPTPRISFYYPLQPGANLLVPQSSVQSTTFVDVNGNGSPPMNGSNAGYSRVRTQNDDGSFSFQQTGATGTNETLTQSADGSGSMVVSSPAGSTTTTLGIPTFANGAFTIPVSRVVTSATPSSKIYSATDWYSNAAQPSAPLILQQQNVVGLVTTLPAQCNGALLQPNMYEIDTNTSNLNTINASLSVTSTRSFNSNGVAVCTLTQQTSSNYSLLTGALSSTTTTQTATLLQASN